MSAHIIGRPNDDLLHIVLGHGADPEQAFIRGSDYERWLTTQLLGDPAIARVDSRITMKLIKRER